MLSEMRMYQNQSNTMLHLTVSCAVAIFHSHPEGPEARTLLLCLGAAGTFQGPSQFRGLGSKGVEGSNAPDAGSSSTLPLGTP